MQLELTFCSEAHSSSFQVLEVAQGNPIGKVWNQEIPLTESGQLILGGLHTAAENINPAFFLESIGSLAVVAALLLMYRKRGLTLPVLGITAASYFIAISLKEILQYYTLGGMVSAYGYSSVPTGLYLGAQTVVFEVFGAFLFAMAFKKYVRQANAGAYGLSLAFWENGILLGILPLISLVSDFYIIGYGPASLSTLVYNALQKTSPGLFVGTLQALPVVGYSVLERISSLLMHYSWGFLVVSSVTTRKRIYLAYALPMGFVDSIVPFAGKLGLPISEGIFFLAGLLALFIALRVRKEVGRMDKSGGKMETKAGPENQGGP